jgi:hypothetical protein
MKEDKSYLICKKDYGVAKSHIGTHIIFKRGQSYEYYTNFGGLNHFVISDVINYPMVFDNDDENNPTDSNNPRLYAYFFTKEEARDFNIDKILK